MQEPEDYTETESRIFYSALEVFAQKGKDGARMQEIADHAGINKALLHYYFRTKDRLYERIFQFVVSHLFRSFSLNLQAATTYPETLRVFIDSYLAFFKSHQHIIRFMMGEVLSGGPSLVEFLKKNARSHPDLPPVIFMERTRQAVESGEIRPVDPMQLLVTIVSSCVAFFVVQPIAKQVFPEVQDLDGLLEARRQHLFDVVYNGLRPESPRSESV